MKKTGVILAVGGLILSLFFAFGGRLPVLERNAKAIFVNINLNTVLVTHLIFLKFINFIYHNLIIKPVYEKTFPI